MKFFIISDIHGSVDYLEKVLKFYSPEEYEQIILLGDLMYHGPRNPFPLGYDPKSVAEILNNYKNEVMAVRGNCDSEVDQMLLNFPIMGDYSMILAGERKIFITHGHIYNEENKPPMKKGDILLHGHTHIPMAEKKDGFYICNPGSISLPKNNYPNSYGVLTKSSFKIKDFDGNVIEEIKFETE